MVIANANDVKYNVASNSTFVYAYGFAEVSTPATRSTPAW